VAVLYRATGGRVPIIGVGGIMTAEDAYEKIKAGATLVEVYTGFVYGGPGMPRQAARGLVRLLDRDGIGRLQDAVGVDAARYGVEMSR
jgi:dihydroorotate dehydrogenase